MSRTTRGRIVQANQVVLDQVDFFETDGFTCVAGLIPAQLVSEIFFQNVRQPWPLLDGSSVTDAQVAAGTVYFHEIPGQPGFYNVRFRPNAVGYWRNLLTYTAGQQISAQDFDVVRGGADLESGLKSSFIKDGSDC